MSPLNLYNWHFFLQKEDNKAEWAEFLISTDWENSHNGHFIQNLESLSSSVLYNVSKCLKPQAIHLYPCIYGGIRTAFTPKSFLKPNHVEWFSTITENLLTWRSSSLSLYQWCSTQRNCKISYEKENTQNLISGRKKMTRTFEDQYSIRIKTESNSFPR